MTFQELKKNRKNKNWHVNLQGGCIMNIEQIKAICIFCKMKIVKYDFVNLKITLKSKLKQRSLKYKDFDILINVENKYQIQVSKFDGLFLNSEIYNFDKKSDFKIKDLISDFDKKEK